MYIVIWLCTYKIKALGGSLESPGYSRHLFFGLSPVSLSIFSLVTTVPWALGTDPYSHVMWFCKVFQSQDTDRHVQVWAGDPSLVFTHYPLSCLSSWLMQSQSKLFPEFLEKESSFTCGVPKPERGKICDHCLPCCMEKVHVKLEKLRPMH